MTDVPSPRCHDVHVTSSPKPVGQVLGYQQVLQTAKRECEIETLCESLARVGRLRRIINSVRVAARDAYNAERDRTAA